MSYRTGINDAKGQYITTTATVTLNERFPTVDDDGGAHYILHAGDVVGMVYECYVSDLGSDFIEVVNGENSSGFVAFGENLYTLPDGSFLSEYSTTSPTKGHKVETGGGGGGNDGGGGGGSNDGTGTGDHGNGTGNNSGGLLHLFDGTNFLGLDLSGFRGWLYLGLAAYVIGNLSAKSNDNGKRK